ncbi:hypothetical protein SAMN04488559_11710 [Isobaculum melis]|uniref:Uncharacterized protein n=1 Tax=Isobaculum melis TaxID=142588 RepID=A0A1H9TWT6_9LACT|nr:hypothetical protein SAMN04488559_11710 [Isobaculum melis]
MEEAQQKAIFLVFPVVALLIGEFIGVLFIRSMILFV